MHGEKFNLHRVSNHSLNLPREYSKHGVVPLTSPLLTCGEACGQLLVFAKTAARTYQWWNNSRGGWPEAHEICNGACWARGLKWSVERAGGANDSHKQTSLFDHV